MTIWWAIFDILLLQTTDARKTTDYAAFVHHWGFWQDWVGLFNKENPSGDVVSNEWNKSILVNAIIVGVAVAVKRLVVGLLLGRQTFGALEDGHFTSETLSSTLTLIFCLY